jgi:hypothetical protein
MQSSFEQRFRTEAESAIRRAREVEQHFSEVRNEVEALRNALRAVKASTEVEVAALRTATAGEIRREAVHLRFDLREVRELAEPIGWHSAIVPDFPKLFEDFKTRKFTLLWRGNRDGFGACDFHGRCDGHPNTLTVILDTDGNIFGGFTPVEWESPPVPDGDNEVLVPQCKGDPSLRSFLFTLKNPHNFPARRAALRAEEKDEAIYCHADFGPDFGDICVRDNCNIKADSHTGYFGHSYTNDTGRDERTFFTGSQYFQVKEIEVFEITD